MTLNLNTGNLSQRLAPLSDYRARAESRDIKQESDRDALMAAKVKRSLSMATPDNWAEVRPILLEQGIPDKLIPQQFTPRWNSKIVNGLGSSNKGGATGELIDRYMASTGSSYPEALQAVQTGFRKNALLKDGRLTPIEGSLGTIEDLEKAKSTGATKGRQDVNPNVIEVISPDGKRVYSTPKGALEGGLTPPDKTNDPMPASALSVQSDILDKFATAKNIDSDLASFENQITAGTLDFGLISNKWNEARNKAGYSTKESRALESFMTSIEKLRNDSLRLNNGVQTDGDAERAWNELFLNINDRDQVLKRIKEIRKINQRGAQLQKLKIDALRHNFGKPEFDFNQLESPSAIIDEGMPNLNTTIKPRAIDIDAELEAIDNELRGM